MASLAESKVADLGSRIPEFASEEILGLLALETTEDGGEDVGAEEELFVDEVEGQEAGSGGGPPAEESVEFLADHQPLDPVGVLEQSDRVRRGEITAALDFRLQVEAFHFA